MVTVTLKLAKVTKNYAVYEDAATGFGKLYVPLADLPGGGEVIPAALGGTLSPVGAAVSA